VKEVTMTRAFGGFQSGVDFVSLNFILFGGPHMVHIIVRHKVADYSRWKEAFDAHLNARKAAGETEYRVLLSVEDPRDVTLFFDWDSLDRARRFLGSEDLKQTMKQAGVVGDPDVRFLEDARSVRRSAAD
jgi:hypothetical protein